MSAWSSLTYAIALAQLPTDLGTLYAAWIDVNPAKSGRLAEIVQLNVDTFRQACVAGGVAMNDDEDTVPTTGYQHCLDRIFFTLGMEMGAPMEGVGYTLKVRSDLWLGDVQRGSFDPIGGAEVLVPDYEDGVLDTERAVEWL